MWKFGLLGRDFAYRKFYRYPNNHNCWISSADGEKQHPHFRDVAENYNVIDVRQSEAQKRVTFAIRNRTGRRGDTAFYLLVRRPGSLRVSRTSRR